MLSLRRDDRLNILAFLEIQLHSGLMTLQGQALRGSCISLIICHLSDLKKAMQLTDYL
jgi:hypothetical protein